jgi:hypothetical protein
LELDKEGSKGEGKGGPSGVSDIFGAIELTQTTTVSAVNVAQILPVSVHKVPQSNQQIKRLKNNCTRKSYNQIEREVLSTIN